MGCHRMSLELGGVSVGLPTKVSRMHGKRAGVELPPKVPSMDGAYKERGDWGLHSSVSA